MSSGVGVTGSVSPSMPPALSPELTPQVPQASPRSATRQDLFTVQSFLPSLVSLTCYMASFQNSASKASMSMAKTSRMTASNDSGLHSL